MGGWILVNYHPARCLTDDNSIAHNHGAVTLISSTHGEITHLECPLDELFITGPV
jgi:hypothetical protein